MSLRGDRRALKLSAVCSSTCVRVIRMRRGRVELLTIKAKREAAHRPFPAQHHAGFTDPDLVKT